MCSIGFVLLNGTGFLNMLLIYLSKSFWNFMWLINSEISTSHFYRKERNKSMRDKSHLSFRKKLAVYCNLALFFFPLLQ